MKYHELIDANNSGLPIALVEHGEMERASLPQLAKKIQDFNLDVVLLDVKALKLPVRI